MSDCPAFKCKCRAIRIKISGVTWVQCGTSPTSLERSHNHDPRYTPSEPIPPIHGLGFKPLLLHRMRDGKREQLP